MIHCLKSSKGNGSRRKSTQHIYNMPQASHRIQLNGLQKAGGQHHAYLTQICHTAATTKNRAYILEWKPRRPTENKPVFVAQTKWSHRNFIFLCWNKNLGCKYENCRNGAPPVPRHMEGLVTDLYIISLIFAVLRVRVTAVKCTTQKIEVWRLLTTVRYSM
jgi:hypothetical protein